MKVIRFEIEAAVVLDVTADFLPLNRRCVRLTFFGTTSIPPDIEKADPLRCFFEVINFFLFQILLRLLKIEKIKFRKKA